MIATLLSALFALGTLAAVAAIAATVREHGAAALAARGALQDCSESVSVRYRIYRTSTLGFAEKAPPRATAAVFTLPVRAAAKTAVQPVLLAA